MKTRFTVKARNWSGSCQRDWITEYGSLPNAAFKRDMVLSNGAHLETAAGNHQRAGLFALGAFSVIQGVNGDYGGQHQKASTYRSSTNAN